MGYDATSARNREPLSSSRQDLLYWITPRRSAGQRGEVRCTRLIFPSLSVTRMALYRCMTALQLIGSIPKD